jgi:hypothetical protein
MTTPRTTRQLPLGSHHPLSIISYLLSRLISLLSKPIRSPLPDDRLFAQGIEAEIPQADRREAEELQRKARSPLAAMRPKNEKA